jgi:putative FmdB family regulatory protein
MPTYEYGCTACGHEWEETQRITESPLELCPRCAKKAAHRLISGGTNFILKGGGWYSDLYSSPKTASKKADANGGASTDSGAKSTDSGTKVESKSEPKAEAKSEAKPARSNASSATG